MCIRAVHVELVPDMSAENFLLAFLRFCNMYRTPSVLYSDNAKTFLTSGKILEQAMSSSQFSEHLQKENIKHIKIPLYSAWVGATWERMIRVIKQSLNKTIGRAKISYYNLLTILSDICNAINSRPITYRSVDNELEVITPNHFLKLDTNPALVVKMNDTSPVWEEDCDRETIVKSLEKREECSETFRETWYNDYLLSMREQAKHLFPGGWQNSIKAGDVVLVQQPNKPRPFWLLGHVLRVNIGNDSLIRSVELKRSDGIIANHSICHLYPLELSTGPPSPIMDVQTPRSEGGVNAEAPSDTCHSETQIASSSAPNDISVGPSTAVYSEQGRPKRRAAVKAATKLRHMNDAIEEGEI